MTKDIPANSPRVERVLAVMVASAIGLSLIAFFAVVIGTATGVRDFTEGAWPTIIVLPMIGLPIGFVLVVVVLVLSFMRRSREAKDDRE